MPTTVEERPRLWRDATQPPPLSSVLRSLSDICTRMSLLHDVPQAFIISDSVRRHIINPLRTEMHISSPNSFDSLDLPTENFRTASLAYSLIEKCLSTEGSCLPIAKMWDVLHTTLIGLSADSQSYIMLSGVWNDVITVLRGQLFLLLVHARISDPHNEFFISTSTVVSGNLPSFISFEVAEHIYSAYKATRCAISLSEQDKVRPIYPTDEFKQLLSDPISAELQIESAALRWRRRASENISQVFPFRTVGERVRNLRKYLLHGECSFWRYFFGILRTSALPPPTSPESRAQWEKYLNRILQMTVTEYGVGCPMFELRVIENGHVIPTFTLSFVESQILGSRAHAYCDLFSVTFSIRRAACDLQCSYIELQARQKRMSAKGLLRRAKWFVEVFELRRRMGCFIDGYEWYIQAQVLQPTIDGLLSCLEGDGQGDSLCGRPQFDVVVKRHEAAMERLMTHCFVGEKLIMARLQAMVSACLNLGELIGGLPKDALECTVESRCSEVLEEVRSIDKDFRRNRELLLRMLSGLQKRGCDSKVTFLLQNLLGHATSNDTLWNEK